MNEAPFTIDDLERLLRETEQAHAQYEREQGRPDDDWAHWYARHLYPRLPLVTDFAAEPEKLPSAEPYLSE